MRLLVTIGSYIPPEGPADPNEAVSEFTQRIMNAVLLSLLLGYAVSRFGAAIDEAKRNRRGQQPLHVPDDGFGSAPGVLQGSLQGARPSRAAPSRAGWSGTQDGGAAGATPAVQTNQWGDKIE